MIRADSLEKYELGKIEFQSSENKLNILIAHMKLKKSYNDRNEFHKEEEKKFYSREKENIDEKKNTRNK